MGPDEARALAVDSLGASLYEARQRSVEARTTALREELDRAERSIGEAEKDYDRLVLGRADARRNNVPWPTERERELEDLDQRIADLAETYQEAGRGIEVAMSSRAVGHHTRELIAEVIDYARAIERQKGRDAR